jgi:hypothetical protein
MIRQDGKVRPTDQEVLDRETHEQGRVELHVNEDADDRQDVVRGPRMGTRLDPVLPPDPFLGRRDGWNKDHWICWALKRDRADRDDVIQGNDPLDPWARVPRGAVFHDHIRVKTPEGCGFCRQTLKLQGQRLDLDVIPGLGRGLVRRPHLSRKGRDHNDHPKHFNKYCPRT